MKSVSSFSNILIFCLTAIAAKVVERERTPIIGILTIDVDQEVCKVYGAQVKSYIPASYVKWLEGAGARVVPIWADKDESYFEDIMNKVNGILIPNANVQLSNITIPNCVGRGNYIYHSTKIIYKIAVRKNASKKFFPIWGIGQGMHLLVMHSVKSTFGVDPRWSYFRRSKMLNSLRQHVERNMRTVPFAYYFSNNCIVADVLRLLRLDKTWKILATKKTEMKLDLVTLLEHDKYPFYGSQFHPERVGYEQLEGIDTCYHTEGAIIAARYFAEFFVNQCRKSKNNFTSIEDEMQQLIWNYDVTFTTRRSLRWTQCYLFEDADLTYKGSEDELIVGEQFTGCCA